MYKNINNNLKMVHILKKRLITIVSLIILVSVSFSGCILLEDSDPDVKFYYYIKVINSDSLPIKLFVPAPESDKITKDISVKNGNAKIEIIIINNTKFLQIESNSSRVIISSSFKEFESVEISKLSSNNIFCNISGNLSLILESIEVLIYEGSDPHYLYYSYSIYNEYLVKSFPQKDNWDSQLNDEYSLNINNGWNSFNISEIEGYRID